MTTSEEANRKMRKALVENFMMMYPKVGYISPGRKNIYI